MGVVSSAYDFSPMKRFLIGSFFLTLPFMSGCATLDRTLSSRERDPRVHDEEALAAIRELSERWETEPVPVGLEPQVFFDDALIHERSENLERRVGRAKKVSEDEPVIKPDRAAEGRATGVYISVLRNSAGLFQAWYDSGTTTYRGRGVGSFTSLGYAYSEDGLTWEKPRRFPSMNNIVMHPVFGTGVYYDRRERRGGHRYKAVYGTVGLQGVSSREGLTFARSRNGTSWRMYHDPHPLDEARSDTLSNIFWDDEIQRYRLYTRTMTASGRSSSHYVRPYVGTSMLSVLARALFIPLGSQPWQHVSDTPAPGDGHIYGMTAFKHGPMYIGKIGLLQRSQIHYALALSRNGADWDLEYAQARHGIIPHGEPGSFDAGIIFPASTAPIEQDGQWLLYYGADERPRGDPSVERTLPYSRSIGLATIRKEGFFYLESPPQENATMTTKAFELAGSALRVNADAREGALRVTLLLVSDEGPDRVWDTSNPVRGDGTRMPVTWPRGELSNLIGETVRLRYEMEDRVLLYGMQVVR